MNSASKNNNYCTSNESNNNNNNNCTTTSKSYQQLQEELALLDEYFDCDDEFVFEDERIVTTNNNNECEAGLAHVGGDIPGEQDAEEEEESLSQKRMEKFLAAAEAEQMNNISLQVEQEDVKDSGADTTSVVVATSSPLKSTTNPSSASPSNSSSATGSSSTSADPSLFLAPERAGMDGIDRNKINETIYELSKNSAYFKNEQRKDQRTEERIRLMKSKLEDIKRAAERRRHAATAGSGSGSGAKAQPSTMLEAATATISNTEERWWTDDVERAVKEKVDFYERTRDLSQTWIHIDMDSYYASVEMRDNPGLIGKPVAVGGNSMISTSNYEARKYGVRSAMPGFIAKKLCPQLILIKPNYTKYVAISKQVQEIFKEYDPYFKPMSLDEANLNVTNHMKARGLDIHGGGPELVAKEIRDKIFLKTRLTASAGIACNRMLSKVCSDMNKPNGQYYLPHDKKAIMDFVRTLPVRKVPGIGKVTEKELKAFGIETCGALFEKRHTLFHIYSEKSFNFFLRASLGIGSTSSKDNDNHNHNDDSDSDNEEGGGGSSMPKSVSFENTFTTTSDRNVLRGIMDHLCDKLAAKMAKKGFVARTLTLKLKTSDFRILTRSHSLAHGYGLVKKEEIWKHANNLLNHELGITQPSSSSKPSEARHAKQQKQPPQRSNVAFRLLGVRLSSLKLKDQLLQAGSSPSKAHAAQQHHQATLENMLTNMKKRETSSSNNSNTSSSSNYNQPPSIDSKSIDDTINNSKMTSTTTATATAAPTTAVVKANAVTVTTKAATSESNNNNNNKTAKATNSKTNKRSDNKKTKTKKEGGKDKKGANSNNKKKPTLKRKLKFDSTTSSNNNNSTKINNNDNNRNSNSNSSSCPSASASTSSLFKAACPICGKDLECTSTNSEVNIHLVLNQHIEWCISASNKKKQDQAHTAAAATATTATTMSAITSTSTTTKSSNNTQKQKKRAAPSATTTTTTSIPSSQRTILDFNSSNNKKRRTQQQQQQGEEEKT